LIAGDDCAASQDWPRLEVASWTPKRTPRIRFSRSIFHSRRAQTRPVSGQLYRLGQPFFPFEVGMVVGHEVTRPNIAWHTIMAGERKRLNSPKHCHNLLPPLAIAPTARGALSG
jgi:hypothetical protein